MSKDEYIQHDPTWLYKVVDGEVDGKTCYGDDIVTQKADGWKDSPGEAQEDIKKKSRKPKSKIKDEADE